MILINKIIKVGIKWKNERCKIILQLLVILFSLFSISYQAEGTKDSCKRSDPLHFVNFQHDQRISGNLYLIIIV